MWLRVGAIITGDIEKSKERVGDGIGLDWREIMKTPNIPNFKNWEPSVRFTICVTIFCWNDTKHLSFSTNLRSWSSVCMLGFGWRTCIVWASFKPPIGPLFFHFFFFYNFHNT